MGESLRTELIVVIVTSQVFVTLQHARCGINAVDCIVVITAIVVRWADACFSPLTWWVLWIIIICLRFELQARALVVHPIIATVGGLWVTASPGSPVQITAVFRVRVMLYLDGWHLRHQMAFVAFSIATLTFHQVHAICIWVCGNLYVPIELRDKHLATSVTVAARREAVWFPILASLVQAVRGYIANTLACSDGTRAWSHRPAAAQTWAKTFLGTHRGLAVVEGLLLVVVTIRAILKIVFGEWGPRSVMTSLGTTKSRTWEEERVCDITHSSTEGVTSEVFPSITVWRERSVEMGKKTIKSLITAQEDKSVQRHSGRGHFLKLVHPDLHMGMSTNYMFFYWSMNDSKYKYLDLVHFKKS